MPFAFEPLEIPEVILVKPRAFHDPRGLFLETYRRSAFHGAGIAADFVQDNLSLSRRWVLRGLHFQREPYAQGKLVACLRGEIFDVAVDLRRGSPHFGRWVARRLSAETHEMLWIPPGFAHGFLVLSEEAVVWYKVSGHEYAPGAEGRIRWNDPDIAIAWPLPPGTRPLLSDKDAKAPYLQSADINFVYRR